MPPLKSVLKPGTIMVVLAGTNPIPLISCPEKTMTEIFCLSNYLNTEKAGIKFIGQTKRE